MTSPNLKCSISKKHTPDFKDLVQKKEFRLSQILNYFFEMIIP